MEPILPGAPWLIAHKSMLGVNKSRKITLNGKDYVLWQNQKGEVFALDNVCPHMQAPLSEGWVCKERNTITCPFHTLEFDGQGRLYKEGKQDIKPITQPLELIVDGDYIWTYGEFKPRIPIPNLLTRISKEYDFIGIATEKSIQGDFLSNLLINYDYNHQNGVHQAIMRIIDNKVVSWEENGYDSKVEQEIITANYSLTEILSNPSLLTIPKTYKTYLEYSFPSTTTVRVLAQLGQIVQANILYPETENITRIFVLVFAKIENTLAKIFFKNSLIKAAATVIGQDITAVENLYPRQKAKIRLPNDEILLYAEKLYYDWDKNRN